MGVLDSILEYKRQKEAQANADIAAIPQGVNAFLQAREQARKSALDEMLYNMNAQKFQIEAQKAPYEIKKLEQDVADSQSKIEARKNIPNLLSSLSGTSGIGVTGASIDPATGDIKYTLGETPEAKDKRELDKRKQETGIKINEEVQVDAQKRMNKLDELLPLIDTFDNQLKAVPVGSGVAGRAKGILKSIEASTTQSDPFAATAVDQIKGTRALVARGLSEVGNLAEQEQKAAERFVKRVEDSEDVRILKDIGFINLLKQKSLQTTTKAGLDNDPSMQKRLKAIDERLSDRVARAEKMGLSKDKINQFIGDDVRAGLSERQGEGLDLSSMSEDELKKLAGL